MKAGLKGFLRVGALLWLAGLAEADIKSSSGNIAFDADANGTQELVISATGLGVGAVPTTNLHVVGNAIFMAGNLSIGTATATSTLQVSGTLGFSTQALSTNTTLTGASGNTVLLVDTTSGNITLDLGYAGNVTGRVYQVKKITNSNTLSVVGGSNSIDGSSVYDLTSSTNGFPGATFFSSGTQWYILSLSTNGVTTWTPTGTSNCMLWLDADDSTKFTLTGSNNVATWGDKSANAYDYTQATDAQKPSRQTAVLNGRAVVRFNGGTQQMNRDLAAISLPFDVFCVSRFHTAPSSNVVVFGDSQWGTSTMFLRHSTTQVKMYGTSDSASIVSGAHTITDFHVYHIRFGKNSASINNILNVDGGTDQTVTAGFPTMHGISLGADVSSNYAPVDIAEFIIYNRDLSSAERAKVRDYLQAKWGL